MTISAETFVSRIRSAQIGDRILLAKEAGPNHFKSCWGHPLGIVIRNHDSLYLGDVETPLNAGAFDVCFSCPLGIVVLVGGRFFLDGCHEISAKEAHQGFSISSAITRLEKKITLAGSIPITEGEWSAWDLHPYGVMFWWGDEVVLVVTKLPENLS